MSPKMYSHTRKVGSMGRYGPRIGRKMRHEARKLEDESNASRACPSCSKNRVKRSAAGIWQCKSCGFKFTGGAHTPTATKKAIETEAAE